MCRAQAKVFRISTMLITSSAPTHNTANQGLNRKSISVTTNTQSIHNCIANIHFNSPNRPACNYFQRA